MGRHFYLIPNPKFNIKIFIFPLKLEKVKLLGRSYFRKSSSIRNFKFLNLYSQSAQFPYEIYKAESRPSLVPVQDGFHEPHDTLLNPTFSLTFALTLSPGARKNRYVVSESDDESEQSQ